MIDRDLEGWLLYDYRGLNPIFWDTVGPISNVTRPCWLWIPAKGDPQLLVSFVDQGRFAHLGIATTLFVNRQTMIDHLHTILDAHYQIAMEYSPNGTLPRVSKVDAGTLEMIKTIGISVVSSADLIQYATQRWSPNQLDSHLVAAHKLTEIVQEAFCYIGTSLSSGIKEYEVAEFINDRFQEDGLVVSDGPTVAVNQHSSDPHFEPTSENSVTINPGDWVLIDLWTRQPGKDAMFGDITWTAYVGEDVPSKNQHVFDAVIGSRDAALSALETSYKNGLIMQGWELDRIARDYIAKSGYGDFFNHRLGHSLGREVHSNAVNLDSWETHDTRELIPGIAITIEPGIYLPEFGVRSEINVFMSETGPQTTTQPQRDVVRIKF